MRLMFDHLVSSLGASMGECAKRAQNRQSVESEYFGVVGCTSARYITG